MDCNCHLTSIVGIEVIIVPELNCQIRVIGPAEYAMGSPYDGEMIFATIMNRELGFQVISESCPDLEEIVNVIRWYSFQKTFINQVA
jgi:hypothetical protein